MGFVTMATTQRRDGVERGGVIVRDVVIINGGGAAKIAGELKVSNVAAVHSYNYVYHNLLEIIRANKKKSGLLIFFFIKLHTQVVYKWQVRSSIQMHRTALTNGAGQVAAKYNVWRVVYT